MNGHYRELFSPGNYPVVFCCCYICLELSVYSKNV